MGILPTSSSKTKRDNQAVVEEEYAPSLEDLQNKFKVMAKRTQEEQKPKKLWVNTAEVKPTADKLENALNSINSRLLALEADNDLLAAELVTATQARDELDEEVKQQRRLLEQVMTFVTTNQPQHTVAPTATVELEDLQAQIQDLDNTVNSPTGQFQALVTMVDKLENRMDMGGVQFGDFQFGCMSDMLIFLSTRSKDIDF